MKLSRPIPVVVPQRLRPPLTREDRGIIYDLYQHLRRGLFWRWGVRGRLIKAIEERWGGEMEGERISRIKGMEMPEVETPKFEATAPERGKGGIKKLLEGEQKNEDLD